jgi:uncharacterized repeat protein (TIGR03803 family)
MKTSLIRFFVTFTSLVVLGQGALADVTFTVTPSAISNTYVGNVTLQISGLTNGESVRIGKYFDANANGTVDAEDLLVQGFRLTDGQATVIGGVTNLNVPGDLDANGTNGAITSVWSFSASAIAQRMTAQYVYRFISPTDRFPTTNVLFNVTNSSYAQSISGTVLNGISPVPNSGILLFPGSGMQTAPVAGAVAGNSGNYSIKVAPGTYTLWAFKSNYLADASTAAVVTLGTGASLSTNLSLLQATQSISGRCVYAGTNFGLAGLLVVCQSTYGLLALGFTETNGNFNVPVNAGQWDISTDDSALAAYCSYLYRNTPRVDATTGSVANVAVTFRRANALFYGTVKDDQNQPLVGLRGYAYDDGDLYEGVGTTDQDGNYFIGVGAGNWWVEANQDDPGFLRYVFPETGGFISITNGQAIQLNVLALVATNHITGNVQINGTNIVGVGVNAYATINGTNYQTGFSHTDTNGNYSLNAANGTWNVGLRCSGDNDSLDNILGNGNYQCPDHQTAVVTNNNATNNFTVSSGPLQVTTTNLLNGTNGLFYSQQLAAVGGQPPYHWSLAPGSGSLPPNLSLATNGILSGIPVVTGTSNFSARVTDSASNTVDQSLSLTISVVPLQVATTTLPNAANGVYYSQQLAAFGGQPPYSWTLWSGSLPSGLDLATNGVISGTTTSEANYSFIVRLTDFYTNLREQALVLTVVASTNLPLMMLYSFSGGGDGGGPNGVMQGADGNFYGTTAYGGSYTNYYSQGLGTLFRMTPPGVLETLYSFSDIDGAYPNSPLAQRPDGSLYGTTEYGGEYMDRWGNTFGTVFRMTTNGAFASLHSFDGEDGAYPLAGLVRGADGDFYGTTAAGGEDYYLNDGTIFKITANDSLTSLCSFSGRNGIDPVSVLAQGRDGNFYGTTREGGWYNRGAIFKMTTNGTLSALYSFTGADGGYNPDAGLAPGADGDLYGTTEGGGTNYYGTVFKITTNGAFTSLHSFNGNDGANPVAGLMKGADGNFYGTTRYGGPYLRYGQSQGTVFKMTPGGALTTVYAFTGGNDGAFPNSTLVQGTDGNFYGTTEAGGAYDRGVVFRLSLGSVPAPVFQSVAKVGGTIVLTWSAVAGQTYQLQFKTSLDQLSWIDSGSAIVATNATVTAWDTPGPDPHRFYRVKVGP